MQGGLYFILSFTCTKKKDYELVLVLVFTMGLCVLLSITRLILLGFENHTIKSDTKKKIN